MRKVSEQYRQQLRREGRQQALSEERSRMRSEVRWLIKQATQNGQNAVVAHWLTRVLDKVEG